MPPDAKLSGLSRRLVLDGLIDESAAIDAQTAARKEKLNLSQYLVNQKLIDAYKLATVAADEFGIPLFDLKSLDRETMPQGLVSEDLIQKHQALLPIKMVIM